MSGAKGKQRLIVIGRKFFAVSYGRRFVNINNIKKDVGCHQPFIAFSDAVAAATLWQQRDSIWAVCVEHHSGDDVVRAFSSAFS